MEWKTKGMEHNIIPNVAGVVLYGGVFDIHLLEQVLVFVPFHQGLHITSLTFPKNWNTCMWYVRNLNGSHFVYTFMLCTNCPHQVHIWKTWMHWVLDFDGVWLWRVLDVRNGNMSNSYKKTPIAMLWFSTKKIPSYFN